MSQTPGFRYGHEVRGNVLVQDLTGWTMQSAGMNQVQREWRDLVTEPHVTAAVTVFSPDLSLGPGPLSHLVEEWSENATSAGIEKLGFVSPKLETDQQSIGMGVPQTVGLFESTEAAIQWASE